MSPRLSRLSATTPVRSKVTADDLSRIFDWARRRQEPDSVFDGTDADRDSSSYVVEIAAEVISTKEIRPGRASFGKSELTPEGIKLAEDVDPNESIMRRTGRNFVGITVALAVITSGLLVFQFLPRKSTTVPATASASTRTGAIPVTSFAVLPFENLTDDKANENLALVRMIISENSEATWTLAWLLEEPYQSSTYGTPITPALLRLDPTWDPLRADPEFRKLYEEKRR